MENKTELKIGNKKLIINHRGTEFDKFIIKEVCLKNTWFRCGVAFDKNDSWIDMGGHIGTFSLLVLANGGTVHSIYEPSKDSMALLQRNLAENDFDNVYTVNNAIWDRYGEVTFYTAPDGAHQRDTLFNHYKTKKLIENTIQAVSFRDVVFPGCCVKMDIEGAELDIIDNCHESFRQIKKMVLEYHFDKDNYNRENYFKRIDILNRYFKNVKYQTNFGYGEKFFPSGRVVYCYD